MCKIIYANITLAYYARNYNFLHKKSSGPWFWTSAAFNMQKTWPQLWGATCDCTLHYQNLQDCSSLQLNNCWPILNSICYSIAFKILPNIQETGQPAPTIIFSLPSSWYTIRVFKTDCSSLQLNFYHHHFKLMFVFVFAIKTVSGPSTRNFSS